MTASTLGTPAGNPPPNLSVRATALLGRSLRRLLVPLGVVGALLFAVAGALGGVKGTAVAAVVIVGGAGVLGLWPVIRVWLLDPNPTGDVADVAYSPFLTQLARLATGSRTRELTTAVLVGAGAVVLAVTAASIGETGLVIIVGLLALLGLMVAVRNRTLFFMFVFAASFSLILYKKFTPFLAESYAVAIYITTVDVVLILCYLIWVKEGTFFADLRAGLRNPVFMLPLAGIAVGLLSSVNVNDQRLVWAEIVRYFFMTALFFYVGIRVRRREHVWAFVLGWLVFLAVQVVVSTSQKYTGSFLGMKMFAISLNPNDPEAGRPAGTQIHPVFLGCVVGMVCAFISCFALQMRKRSLSRYLLLGCIPLAFVPTLLSRSRGPLVALIPTVAFIFMFAVRKKYISPRVVIVTVLLGLIGLGIMHTEVENSFNQWFGGGSRLSGNINQSTAGQNWNARWKLNQLGFRMVREHPWVGVGLNSFENQIPHYAYEEIPFENRPAHNLYVVMAAETGLIGLGMTLTIGLVYARYAYRLTRMKDPFYVTIGIGALAALVFVSIEELNSFTLKQDIPLALFWALFGLVVAANRMADTDAPPLPASRWLAPAAIP